MNSRLQVLHVVERIDDTYGGPAKSIPFTAWFSSTPTVEHRIYAGRYDASDRNSVCDQFGLTYQQFNFLGSTKIAFSPGLFRAIYRFVRESETPIVHVHNAWNSVPFFVFLLRLFIDFKVVVSVRGSLFPWSLDQRRTLKRLAWRVFQKRLLLKADVVHVTSEAERDQVCRLGVCENLKLIPNGVFLDTITSYQAPDGRKEANAYPLRLLFVSRVHPKKGLEILLSALSSGLIDFDVELVVAGNFSNKAYRNKIEGMLDDLGDNVSTTFLGHVDTDRMDDLYDNADLFVLPSYTENFGIAIAEALSHGLPVITTVHTPWLEIKMRGAGYVIDTSQSELLTALLEFKNTTKEQRIVMSKNALALIEKYDWRQLSTVYQQMYEELG